MLEFYLGVPYWLVNKTGLALQVKVSGVRAARRWCRVALGLISYYRFQLRGDLFVGDIP